MALKFVTTLSVGVLGFPNEEAMEEVREGARQLRAVLRSQKNSEADLLLEYGSLYGRKDGVLPKFVVAPLREGGDLSALVIAGMQVDEGMFGLPPIYAFSLALEVAGSARALCESLPFSSLEHARTFFEDCLNQSAVRTIADALGKSEASMAFALCALPYSAEPLVSRPNPVLADVDELAKELARASKRLSEVVEKWRDTDAFKYLVGRHGMAKAPWLFQERSLDELGRLPEILEDAMQGFGTEQRRRGRRVGGGRDHLVSLLIRELWLRCGMKGKVSTSPGSRFMKACSLILPTYGIPKADYAQFMKAELSKRRQKGVVIGR